MPMLQFVNEPQSYPDKRKAEQRKQDFGEIYAPYPLDGAQNQAARCSQCGVPYCQVHCPVSNNIPDWLMLVQEGRLREAYELSSETNMLPEVCGRICPQDRLCEGHCVIEQSGHGAVTIGSIEKFITENAFEEGWIAPIKPRSERKQSVAIIGAGPAGLAAAVVLRKAGVQVTIFDRYDRAGGLLIYGIPGFKLEKSVVERRYDWLKSSGVKFELNCDIGRDKDFNNLRQDFDAVLVATGVYKARALSVEGQDLDQVVPALSYLTASNRAGLADDLAQHKLDHLDASGKNVVVIGGGDTAMDCVRTAIRQGARSVKCLYRRDQENMPGSQREVQNAIEEGVEFLWLSEPLAFKGKTSVEAVVYQQMRLGIADASGRQSPEAIPNSQKEMPADLVIHALGFQPEELPTLFSQPELPVTPWGTLRIDWKTMQSALDGVYGAGDIVRGASLVVWGIHDGRQAALAMLEQFEAQENKTQAA